MRVLVLSNMWPSRRMPLYGTFVKAHVDAVRALGGVDLRVVAIREPRRGWRTPLKYGWFALRAWAAGLARRFDIVHVHYAYPTALGAPPARWRGAKMAVTAHGSDVNEMLLHRAPGPTRRVFARADQIIAVSQDLAGKIRAAVGAGCPPIEIINTGIHPNRIRERERPPGEMADPPRVLFAARLIRGKGGDVLLDALARVRCAWRLDVVGDGPERAALEAQAQRLGLTGRITWHGLAAPHEMAGHCAGADLAVVASRQEGLGLTALEPMACGVPVVATAVGGLPEVAIHEDSALLVPPDDAAAMASAIERLLTDRALRLRLIEGGHRVAAANTQARSVARLMELYRRMAAR